MADYYLPTDIPPLSVYLPNMDKDDLKREESAHSEGDKELLAPADNVLEPALSAPADNVLEPELSTSVDNVLEPELLAPADNVLEPELSASADNFLEPAADYVLEPELSASADNVLEPEKEFLLLYESLPELWDTTHPQYYDACIRNESLDKLLTVLRKIIPNASIVDVKRCLSGIAFLQGHLEQRDPQPHQTQLDPVASTSASMDQSSAKSSPTPRPPPPKRKRKRSPNEIRNAPTEEYITTHPRLSQPITVEWSNILDRLDPIQALFAKKAINDILFEAQLGNLNKCKVSHVTVKIPSRTVTFAIPPNNGSSPENEEESEDSSEEPVHY